MKQLIAVLIAIAVVMTVAVLPAMAEGRRGGNDRQMGPMNGPMNGQMNGQMNGPMNDRQGPMGGRQPDFNGNGSQPQMPDANSGATPPAQPRQDGNAPEQPQQDGNAPELPEKPDDANAPELPEQGDANARPRRGNGPRGGFRGGKGMVDFDALVTQGVISQETCDNIKEYMRQNPPQDMNRGQQPQNGEANQEGQQPQEEDLLSKLLSENVITQAEYDAIVAAQNTAE